MSLTSKFNLTTVEKKYSHTVWVKALNKSSGCNYDLLLDVLEHAENGTTQRNIKGGRYYSAARFVSNFAA